MKKDVKKLVELQINGENIQIEKKKIKNMYLRISPANGEIRVSAPERMSVKNCGRVCQRKMELDYGYQKKTWRKTGLPGLRRSFLRKSGSGRRNYTESSLRKYFLK